MAKLALIFLAVFCIFQIAIAARIARDTSQDDIVKGAQNLFEDMKAKLDEALSKDNLDKVSNDFKELSEKLISVGSDLAKKIQEATKSA